MDKQVAAFLINSRDNVATALSALEPGEVALRGDGTDSIFVTEKIPAGHKLALRDIAAGEDIVKYGVRIGRATENIPQGRWVHLMNMRSVCDERSAHLDTVTGAPKDTRYE